MLLDTYYPLTINIVANQLMKRLLAARDNNRKEVIVREQWIKNRSKFSLDSLLQNTPDGLLQLLDKDH